MEYSSGQLSIDGLQPACRSIQYLSKKSNFNAYLLIETSIVFAATVLAVRILTANPTLAAAWFMSPAILVAAAIIPRVLRKDKFPEMDFSINQITYSLKIIFLTGIFVFPVLFLSLWLMIYYRLEFPLQPMLPRGQNLFCWVIYQFMYIAVAEELFFRSYLQTNILKLANGAVGQQHKFQKWMSIVITAACFAVAHIIVQGQVISVLTFFPGLVFGWLFVRTRTILAPILFHGLANTSYLLMIIFLT